VVKELRVWPRSHALVQLQGGEPVLTLPLSADVPALLGARRAPLAEGEQGFRLAA
jgi:hypothetical protein